MDQMHWPSFDADLLNSLSPPENGLELTSVIPPPDYNDLFTSIDQEEPFSEAPNKRKRRATGPEHIPPVFMPSSSFEIEPSLPQDEL